MTRVAASFLLLAATLLTLLVLAVGLGAASIPPAALLEAFLSKLGSGASPLSPLQESIVWQLRLPRALTAAAVGAGLALSGAVMQALTRNPLADPYLFGLSSGASLAVVLVLVTGLGIWLPPTAFLGATVALACTLIVASAMGALTPTRMVLAGIAVSSLAAALTSLLIFWGAEGDAYREVLSWLLGSVAGARWPTVAVAGSALLLLGLPLWSAARRMDAFAFGDVAAAALGVPVAATRWWLLCVAAMLTGAVVSVSGSIGFVGLVAPHAARLLVGGRHALLLPLAALLGAALLVAADIMARTLLDPREIPVGVVTALLGVPAFVVLLLRSKGKA